MGDTGMPASTFQKGDRVVLKESYENVEGQIIFVLKDHMYKIAWDSGLTYKGKTTIIAASGRGRLRRPCRAVRAG